MNDLSISCRLALAGLLIMVSTGCPACETLARKLDNEDPPRGPAKILILKCDKATNSLQLYSASYYTFGGVDNEMKTDSRLNGKPCSVSKEFQGRPFTVGPAASALFQTPTAAPQRAKAQSAKAQKPPVADADPVFSPLALFPWLAPAIFNPTPASPDRRTLPIDCPSNLGGFLINHLQNTVTAFGLCPLRQVREIFVPPNPLQLAVTPDGSLALVTSYGTADGGALTFINTATGAIAATMQLFNYNPSGIAISPDGTRAYLTHYLELSPSIVVIDIPNRRVLSTIPLPLAYPRVIALTPDGSQAWVNYYQGGIVTVVDLLTATVAGTVNITQPVSMGIAFNRTGTKAFVAAAPNQLYVIDTATLAVKTRITVGQAPSDVVVTLDGNFVLLNSDVENGTWWVDARTERLLGRSKDPTDTTGGTLGLLIFR